MTDPAALFRSARQKAGHLPISEDARAALQRWLEQKRADGWAEADESEYLAAVAEDIKDSGRLKAAEEFWQTRCSCTENSRSVKVLQPISPKTE